MTTLSTLFKKQLGRMLAKGHAKFGTVAPRKPYYDEDRGGAGTAGLRFEAHPLLAEQPVGAASDLTAIISDFDHITEVAQERATEACPQLQQQPAMRQALGIGPSAAPTAKPT